MTTTTVTPHERLTTLKHLATGKGIDVVATIVHLPKDQVRQIAAAHGYPDRDKLAWAVDVLETKIEEGGGLEERRPAEGTPIRPTVVTPPPDHDAGHQRSRQRPRCHRDRESPPQQTDPGRRRQADRLDQPAQDHAA